LTAEQLTEARREHWRQNKNPLASDDVRAWIDRHPLSLFLPRRAQLPAPGPSFVEAVEGEANATPPLAAAERASDLLAGSIESGAVIPLNLLGGAGEQPDFLAQAEILPFVAALRGDRDWKQPPASAGGRHVSPLILDLWSLLERSGPMTAAAARETLGRELTESAVLRALDELWQRLRAIPILQTGGKPAVWEVLKHRHAKALSTGSGTSQVTAISLLVSTYLQSVYAASSAEIEIFLSPLVSRSRIREAVRGLSATRQIQSLSMESQTYYFLEGGLPEFAPVAESGTAEPARQWPAAEGQGAIAAVPSFAPRAPRTPRPNRIQSGFQSQSRGRPEGRPGARTGNWSKGSGKRRAGDRPRADSARRSADASGTRYKGRPNDRASDATGARGGAGRPPQGAWKPRPAAWSRRPESGPPSKRQEGNRPNPGRTDNSRENFAAQGGAKWRRFSETRPPGKRPAPNAMEGPPAREGRDQSRGGASAWKPRRDSGPRSKQEGRPSGRPGTPGGGTRGGFDSRKPHSTERNPSDRATEKRFPAKRDPQTGPRSSAKPGSPRFSNPRFAGSERERSSRPNPGRFGNRDAGPRQEGTSDVRPERRPWKDRPVLGESAPGRPSSGRPSSGRPSSGRPSSGRPSSGRPSSGRPSSGRPSSSRPSSGRPSSDRPSSGRPSSGRPSSGRPASGRPQNRTSGGSFRPNRQKPDSRKTGGQKTGFRKTGSENRGTRAGGPGGFRDKKPQASFPGKKWPKKKPEA